MKEYAKTKISSEVQKKPVKIEYGTVYKSCAWSEYGSVTTFIFMVKYG